MRGWNCVQNGHMSRQGRTITYKVFRTEIQQWHTLFARKLILEIKVKSVSIHATKALGESRNTALVILKLITRWWRVVNLMAPAVLPPVKYSKYPVNRKLDGPQSRSWRFETENREIWANNLLEVYIRITSETRQTVSSSSDVSVSS